MIFDFPEGTFALFVFPYDRVATKYFAGLAAELEPVKRGQFDLITQDARYMAVTPYDEIRGLRWNSKRPDKLVVHSGIDTGTPWFQHKVMPAMGDGYALMMFDT